MVQAFAHNLEISPARSVRARRSRLRSLVAARTARSVLGAAGLCAAWVLCTPGTAYCSVDEPSGERSADPYGPRVEVTSFRLSYFKPGDDLPEIESFYEIPVTLGDVGGEIVAPMTGEEEIYRTTIGELVRGTAARRYSASAFNAIATAIVNELNKRGYIGVSVFPDPRELDSRTGQDRRDGQTGELALVILTARVGEVSTTDVRETNAGDAKNKDRHERIRRLSPVQGSEEQGTSGDALRRDLIERYTARLNRQPARRVDPTIEAGDEPGEVVLDYLVSESKPWTAYFQLSNTGTDETTDYRERFGFIHNRLTNNDDRLTLDYSTGDFEDVHSFFGTYEAPVGDSTTLRWRAYGSYYEFESSQFGQEFPFVGDGFSMGAELIGEILYHDRMFVDLVGGVRWDHIATENQNVGLDGDGDFLLPYIGLRAERFTGESSFTGSLTLETALEGFANETDESVAELGRTAADNSWAVVRGDASLSFYLEPLLTEGWEDPANQTTLAHEIALSARGQYTLGNTRLIPQATGTVGGFYSVRGYEESSAAGDDTFAATVEYRLHIPATFAVDPEPGELFGRPFRWAPDRKLGRADWDLIVRAFFDAGLTFQNERFFFEENEELIGAGVGGELQVSRNVNVRLDWGIALKEAAQVSAGSNRFHLSLTVLY